RAEVEIAQLKREVNVADKKYQRYAENVEEARIDQAMQESRISSLNVVQAATFQEKPVSPSKLLTAVVAVMMAIAGSVVIGYIAIRYDDTIVTTDDVRDFLNVPVWGAIPDSRKYGKVVLR
ncbi:MAG: GNVR domain-containing protein, partial [Planctomycetota bacterium]